MPNLVATLIYLPQNYSYYISGDRSPLIPQLYILEYLQVASNFKHRKALPKLRVSDHKLNIEVGRHTKLFLIERMHIL